MQQPKSLDTAFIKNNEHVNKNLRAAKERSERRKRKKVLVIDSDEKFLREIKKAFEALGIKAIVSTNPLSFFKQIGKNNIQAVVVGIVRTGETCLDILAHLQGEPYPKIAIGSESEWSELPEYAKFCSKNQPVPKLAENIMSLAS